MTADDLLRRLDYPGRVERIGHDIAVLCADAAVEIRALRERLAAARSAIREGDAGHWPATRGGALWWVDNEGPVRLVTDAEAEVIRAATADPTPPPDGDDG